MIYYDPKRNVNYIEGQLRNLPDTVKERLVEVTEDKWETLLSKVDNTHSIAAGTDGRPVVQEHKEDPALIKVREMSEAQRYLASTDYMVIKCMEYGKTMEELYPEASVKREEARETIRSYTDNG